MLGFTGGRKGNGYLWTNYQLEVNAAENGKIVRPKSDTEKRGN